MQAPPLFWPPQLCRSCRALATSLVLVLGLWPASWAQSPQLNLPREVLRIGMFKVDAQIASTPNQREIGLMHRTEMPNNEGMLFVFEQAHPYCFWMKNTTLPLSIAFINQQGRVTNIANMEPLSEANHCASEPVRFALEMNQGWFDQHRVAAGSVVRGSFWTGW